MKTQQEIATQNIAPATVTAVEQFTCKHVTIAIEVDQVTYDFTGVTYYVGNNEILVINFGSPHQYEFSNGAIISAPDAALVAAMSFERHKEDSQLNSEVPGMKVSDGSCFDLIPTGIALAALKKLNKFCDDRDARFGANAIVVPLPVRQALDKDGWWSRYIHLRTGKIVSRDNKKVICHDDFLY